MAQIFIGRKSLVIDVFGMKTEKEFVNTLEDVIRRRGAMDKLISDSAITELSARVMDILRALCIDNWQSEANYQHQNFAEHRWNHCKRLVFWWMNRRNVPGYAWLLCLEWVADVMNATAEKSLGGRLPLQVLLGQTIDISIYLLFLFWDIVYVPRYKGKKYQRQVGSQKSDEIRGRFVGFAWHCGHALTFKILTDDTKKIIYRSRVRLAVDGENNLKLDAEAGKIPKRIYFRSKRDDDLVDENFRLPTINAGTNPFTVEQEEAQPSPEVQENPNVPDDRPEEPEDEDPPVPPLMLSSYNSDSDSDDDDDDSDDNLPGAPDTSFSAQARGESNPVLSDLTAENLPEDYSPMDDPPLQTLPEVTTVEEEDLQLPPGAVKPLPGESTDDKPFDFRHGNLRTDLPTEKVQLPPEEMIDRTFLMPPEEDGSRFRAKIIARVNAHKEDLEQHPEVIKFRCIVNDDYEEVVAYNDIVDYIEQDQTWDGIWKFRAIRDHKKVSPSSKDYKGSSYNVLVEWETGELTWEPLKKADKTGIYDHDPVTVGIYARENNLLDTPGWKLPGLKKIAKTQQRLIRRANQAKLHSYRNKPVYMFGVLVPRNHEQAMELDAKNGNTKWRDAEIKEIGCMDEYDVFESKGKGYNPGPDWKKIRIHMVYAVKHDGRHRARLVAGGHLTDTPIDSVYSSVVSLRGVRILAFLSELNDLKLWATDISSAYLCSLTTEKVYIIAGPEFGEREGHTLLIIKALYGLKSSGARWHERFADILRQVGFVECKAEPDIWMRDKGDHYEYIAVYVDDLMILSKDPQGIVDIFEKDYSFTVKGTGPVDYHLGCDFFRDKDGTLCYAPRKYIEKLLFTYEKLFGTKPKQYRTPLEKGDHPELDTTALLDDAQTRIYQSLIGALQWVVQIGRFDVTTSVMTLSRFRAAPRFGHMLRVKRIYGYLSKNRHAIIRVQTEEPDYSDIPEKKYDWEYTVYHGAKEEIPHDMPIPRGKRVKMTSFFDANLYHDLISGKSVTGILHLFNKTPIDWFSKLQSTAETATFGSEYVAARTCTEQIIDLRTTLRYMGVPVEGPTMVFGDNESVINTGSVPHGKLTKRHNALSFHRVREAVAAGITVLHYIPGNQNPADLLSKHWDWNSAWPLLKPLMFSQWEGDSADGEDQGKSHTLEQTDCTTDKA
jgi:hypothetical protein